MIEESSFLEKEHATKSCPSLTSTTFAIQQTKNTAKSILDEDIDDATSSSFTDSSSQGPSSVDTDFDKGSLDCDRLQLT
jgi:hypothetical protein